MRRQTISQILSKGNFKTAYASDNGENNVKGEEGTGVSDVNLIVNRRTHVHADLPSSIGLNSSFMRLSVIDKHAYSSQPLCIEL